MSSDVDKMFEDLFGYRGSSESPPKPEPVAGEADRPPGTVEDAARAVREAVVAHTGRKRPVGAWRPVAAKVLGLKRMVAARWDEVLAKGVGLGLFSIDEKSLSYPVLVPLDPDPEDAEWERLEAKQEAERADQRERAKLPPPPPKDPPKDWDPVGHLPCGHWEWQNVKVDRARDDPRRVGPDTRGVRVRRVEDCLDCKAGRPANPQHQAPEHRTVVPERMRRTAEREAGPGWPGYCVDDDGYYIGGIFNHCLYANGPEGPHCVVHRGRSRRRSED